MVIDAAVHPQFRTTDDIRAYMAAPWSTTYLPAAPRVLYPAPTGHAPFGEFRDDARPREDRPAASSPVAVADEESPFLPGSDPALARRHLDELGSDRAVLLPYTRGLVPNVELGSRICAATNDWLAETWLGEWNADGRFYGSIRVNPEDPEGAVREIERWADHPRMVLVAVPLEAHNPYGKRAFAPVWAAAAEHGFPVAVKGDGGAGTDFAPDFNGWQRQYAAFQALQAPTYVVHLASLIAEGTFERLPDLKFVFVDGGADLLAPIMWRMDMDWPIARVEVPWVKRTPSDYIEPHVRFCTSRLEGPEDDLAADWLEATEAADFLLFASHYPHWSNMSAAATFPTAPAQLRARVLADNALRFYPRLAAAAPLA
jgi:predicted TIM-barrel fold metal-dependent hydrolase